MGTLCKNWTQWLIETRFAGQSEESRNQTIAWLDSVGTAIVNMSQLKPDDTVIDIGTGTGLLAFKAIETLENLKGNGKVIFSDKFPDCLVTCEEFLKNYKTSVNYEFLNAPCEDLKLPENSVDKAMLRSVLVHIVDKQPAIDEIYRILKPGGYFCGFEPIIRSNTKCWELVEPSAIENFYEFKNAEDTIMSDSSDSLCNFDDMTIKANMTNAGFSDTSTMIHMIESKYVVTEGMIKPWFNAPPSPDRPTMKERYLKFFDEKKINKYIDDLERYLLGREINIKTKSVLIHATK